MQGKSERFAKIRLGVAWMVMLGCASCGYNSVIDADENVKAAWADVENQYKRRSDLIPNLVQTVKGSSNFEKETLEAVVQARSQVAGVKVDKSVIDDPASLQKFEAAQQQLSGSLARLMVVAEKYPDLKASAQFQELQGQLEGTENRIAVARSRYNGEVSAYNKIVLQFPSSIGAKMRGKEVRETFKAPEGSEKAPEVKF